mgnify:CR=1 FL=1
MGKIRNLFKEYLSKRDNRRLQEPELRITEPERPIMMVEGGIVERGMYLRTNVFDPYNYFIPINYNPILPEPEKPMVLEEIYKLTNKPARTAPTITSLPKYHERWCGTTIADAAPTFTEQKDPSILDHEPLRHFLKKFYSWILDVTEVRVKSQHREGPLEIHITVSPTHAIELMNPSIEKKVRENLNKNLSPLISCMYSNNSK